MKNHLDSDSDMEETATILNDLDMTINNLRDGFGLKSGLGTAHGRGPQPTDTVIIIDDDSDGESIIDISDTE